MSVTIEKIDNDPTIATIDTDLKIDMSVTIATIDTDLTIGMSVTIATIDTDLTIGMSVSIGTIDTDLKIDMSVTIATIDTGATIEKIAPGLTIVTVLVAIVWQIRTRYLTPKPPIRWPGWDVMDVTSVQARCANSGREACARTDKSVVLHTLGDRDTLGQIQQARWKK
jgi:hypothetical protein